MKLLDDWYLRRRPAVSFQAHSSITARVTLLRYTLLRFDSRLPSRPFPAPLLQITSFGEEKAITFFITRAAMLPPYGSAGEEALIFHRHAKRRFASLIASFPRLRRRAMMYGRQIAAIGSHATARAHLPNGQSHARFC